MSSLRDFDRVEDRIRQHRQVEKRPVLIVEGPDDLLVLKHHVDPALIFPADGKVNVVRATRALRDWLVPGVRGLVDADFEEVPIDDCILCYDARDMEGMLVALGVLDTVLEHRGSAAKLRAQGGVAAVTSVLVAGAVPVAKLRAANARNSWGLRFDGVDVTSKINLSTLALNLQGYCAALISVSDTSISARELLDELVADLPDDRGPRGRDVVALAGVALRRKVGTLPAAVCQEAVLSAQLRSSAGLVLERSQWLAGLRRALDSAADEVAA